MKRDELKQYTSSEIEEIDDARLDASEDGIINMTRAYIASEADKVMDAMEKQIRTIENDKEEMYDANLVLQARIKELEAQLENVQSSMYAENVDANMALVKANERIKELEAEVIGYKASLERANFKMCEKDARVKELECDKAYLENDKQVCAKCLRLKELEAENARLKATISKMENNQKENGK